MQEFILIENLNVLQIEQLFKLIQKVQWPRTMDELEIMLKNSMSFGLVETTSQKLVGFARVLTDEAKYAFILAIFLVWHQDRQISKLQKEAIDNLGPSLNKTNFCINIRLV